MKVRIYRDKFGLIAADVPPQYTLVGYYLNSDIQSSAPIARKILEMIQVSIEQQDKLEIRGNAYKLTLTPESAIIKPDFLKPEETCTIPIGEFQDILGQWLEFVENSKKDKIDENTKPTGYPTK